MSAVRKMSMGLAVMTLVLVVTEGVLRLTVPAVLRLCHAPAAAVVVPRHFDGGIDCSRIADIAYTNRSVRGVVTPVEDHHLAFAGQSVPHVGADETAATGYEHSHGHVGHPARRVVPEPAILLRPPR